MNDRFDDTLFSILKETKTIPNFFDSIFGFLFRRTDFYHITSDPKLGVGLMPGLAENLLLNVYKKYEMKPERPEISEREEIVTEETNTIPVVEKLVSSNENPKCPPSLDSYNGAVYETHSWSQTITDIDVQVKLPDKLASKQLIVDVTASKICVKLKNSNTIYLDGELCHKCKAQETVWSLDGSILQIHLEKVTETWWDCLIQTEPRLDLGQIDCSRPFHELSDEAQAKIEELTWNQERKKQGLPTSDQLELEKKLKEAWNAEGSPFTGEYDPSKVSLH